MRVYFARTCCKIRHFTGPVEIELHPCLNHHFFERQISRENAAKYDFLGNLCSPSVNPPATFLDFVTHDLLVMLGMLVGHAGDVENDAGDVDELV